MYTWKNQLSDGFKRPIHWISYQTIPSEVIEKGKNIYELLIASFQGVKRLFILGYAIAANAVNNEAGIKDNKKCFLLRGVIKDYNVLIDGKNFMINQLMI